MNSLLCFRPMFVVENYLQMRSNVSELLKKLNERISQADIASLSTIEYDLLLQDLRELYDRVIDERKAVRYKESVPEEKVQSFVPPVFEEKEVLHLEVKQPQIHKKVKEPVSEPEVKAPVLTKNAPPNSP